MHNNDMHMPVSRSAPWVRPRRVEVLTIVYCGKFLDGGDFVDHVLAALEICFLQGF